MSPTVPPAVPPSVPPAPPQPAAAPLLDQLRADILAGGFRPGEWLRQIDLETRYGANRSVVRRALETLASAGGLVEHVLNRGFRVCTQDAAQRHELTDLRLMIELPVARSIAASATAAQAAMIAAAARAFDDGVERVDMAEIRRLNHAFHAIFWEAAPNRTAARLINDLRERDLPGAGNAWANPGTLRQSSEDHLQMAAAVAAQDAETLCNVITRHLNRWRSI